MDDLYGLLAWKATNSGGDPICIADNCDDEGSLSVSLYVDDEGVLRGVEVWGVNDGLLELMTLAGEFPTEAVEELLGEEPYVWHTAGEVMEAYDEKYPEGEGLTV